MDAASGRFGFKKISAARGSVRGAVLIQPKHIPRWIAKARGDFRQMRANWLHDLATPRYDFRQHSFHTGGHDVDQNAGRIRGRDASDPDTAHLADAVRKVSVPSPRRCVFQPKTFS